MKIFFDGRLFGVRHRGLGMYSQKLLESLRTIDQTNEYYILNSGTADYLKNQRWQIIRSQEKVYGLGEQINLPWRQYQIKPQLTHFPHFNAPILAQRPYVVTVHDLIIHQHPSERSTTLPGLLYKTKLAAYYLVVKQALQRAQIIITVSQSAKNDIIEYYPKVENKIKVIYEAPCLTLNQHQGNSLVKGDYWLYVGAAYPHKNLELLLTAFKQIQPSNTKLVLVGRGDYFYDRLKLLASELGLTNKVIFWGEATQESLVTLYYYCNYYIAPGLAEGFDLSALQAAVFNKPIIASRIPVHQEILESGAWYFDPHQLSQLAEILSAIDKNEVTNYQHLQPSRDLLAKFNWPKTASETLNLYQRLN